MCIHCERVSLNPMTGVIIYLSVKRFERASGPEKRYIRTSYHHHHVKRHQNLLKGVLEGRLEGSRPRGRPRINWEENVKNWSGLKLQECTRMAEEKWRDDAINLRTGRRYLDR